jgi:hypothetical protein
MSCILRASGVSFDVDAFVQSSPLEWVDLWHVGELKKGEGRGRYDTSGAQIVVGEGDDFNSLLADATAFLNAHSAELARLTSTAGVDGAVFDFGLTWNENYAARYAHFPAAIVKLAAAVNCSLELSFYDFR